MRTDEHGLPVGEPVDWTPRPAPDGRDLVGEHCRVVRLSEEHVPGLYDALCRPGHEGDWTYISTGPFATLDGPDGFAAYAGSLHGDARLACTILSPAGTPVGTASYLRIQPDLGSAEVGSIVLGPDLQRTVAATEAMYLMARHVFEDLGYRRYEWKCDSLNARSRAAALRLGFSSEGTWRNALVYKGRNRDTAWFAMTDSDWDRLRPAYDAWLDPSNHGPSGQRRRLSELTARALRGSA